MSAEAKKIMKKKEATKVVYIRQSNFPCYCLYWLMGSIIGKKNY